jgi:hypothetical protein
MYWLRHYATSRMIADLRPDEVDKFFSVYVLCGCRCLNAMRQPRNPASRKRLQKGNPFPRDITQTIKYCLWSRRTQALEGLRWRGPAATVNYRSVPSSERALQNNKPATLKKISRRKKNWSQAQMVARYQDRLADWPSVVRFFLWIPFYLQAVQIHSANGVKFLEAWRGVPSSTPPYR